MQPHTIKYHYKDVCPDYSTLSGLVTALLIMSQFAFQELEMHSFPVFVPNDYLYNEYAKTIPNYKELSKTEIYAHAVEDFVRK